MDFEIVNGERVGVLPYEMTALDVAIKKFERKAKYYYTKKVVPKNETPENRTAREKELAVALLHLKHERKKVAIQAQIQARLQEYYAWGRKMAEEDPFALLEEKHHPTRILARHMRAVGRPQPSSRHTPHHIVEGKGKNLETVEVRLNLHIYGIRINDPDNGVWMPRTKADKGHWSMPKSPAHSEIHTYNYETWVNTMLAPLDNETTIRGALLRIRCMLRDGLQPPQVTAKKNVNWRPVL